MVMHTHICHMLFLIFFREKASELYHILPIAQIRHFVTFGSLQK